MLKRGLLLLLLAGSSFAWWDPAFSYRTQVNISNSGSNLTDYQVNISLNTQALIAAGKMRSDCADLRLVASNDSSQLPYWIEGICNATTTKTWAKLPAIPTGTSTIYAYYGNPSATSASNESATFYISNRNFDSTPLGRNWTCSASGAGACNAAYTGDNHSSPNSGYAYETSRACTRAHLRQTVTLPDISPLYVHYWRRYWCNTWGGTAAVKINVTSTDWGSGTFLAAWSCPGGGTTSAWGEFWNDISAFKGQTVMLEMVYHDDRDNDPTYCHMGDHGLWLRIDDISITTRNSTPSSVPTASFGTEQLPDTTAPSVLIQSPTSQAYSTAIVPVNFTATDDIGISSCTVLLNGNVNSSTCSNYTLNLTNGAYTLNVTANDTSGNINSAQASFNVAVSTEPQSSSSPQISTISGIADGNVTFSFTPAALRMTVEGQEYPANQLKASAGVNNVQIVTNVTSGGQTVTDGTKLTYTIFSQ